MIRNTLPLSSCNARHRPDTVSRWQAVLADFVASGLGVGEFCRTRRVCEQSFYAWRKRLSHGSPGGALFWGPGFVPVVVRDRGTNPTEGDDACATVQLRGGRMLRLPVSMPAARMAELVHALEGLE